MELDKKTYTNQEIQNLTREPNLKECTFLELRNWAIVCYFLETGNRLSTSLNLQLKDVNLQTEVICIREIEDTSLVLKTIRMSKELKSVLQKYLQLRKGEAEDYLFCDSKGNQLTKAALIRAIIGYNRSRGVEKTSIHVFRYTFQRKKLKKLKLA